MGPTHDDVTMKGVALGFGVKLVEHPELLRILSSRYKDLLNEWVLKMAEVPEGSEIIAREDTRFPIV
ncbi:MAG TPA: competence/damage-inducible protein A, partial [Nitrospirae bacterium]|nr:competence/damage-inducible protein A [Nitrospirota bacterium]